MTEIRRANVNDRASLCALAVAPDQDHFVAPNDMTFRQADTEGGSEVYGLYDGTTPVGLLAIVDTSHPDADTNEGEPPDAIYIWRLMVDANHQSKGHGTAALAFAEALGRARVRTHMVISVVPDENSAQSLYERHGYQPTGRLVEGEVEMSKQVQTD